MSDLAKRQASFGSMVKAIQGEKMTKPSWLIAAVGDRSAEWWSLQQSAMEYMRSSLTNTSHLNFDLMMQKAFIPQATTGQIPNITPNGMIVPKRHLNLEYNMLVRAFAKLMDSLGIAPFISSWHVPLNLRIKLAEPNAENMTRHHPTEHVHSDSWAGESAESVTVHIPIWGDTDKNRVVFYEPPADFQEDWLGPRPSYLDGAEIAEKYQRLDFVPQLGSVVLADFATLHSSTREPGCGARVSIDTTFHLKRDREPGVPEMIHPWRMGERCSHEVLCGIGETSLFYFADPVGVNVDSQGGYKHPTNLQIVRLGDG